MLPLDSDHQRKVPGGGILHASGPFGKKQPLLDGLLDGLGFHRSFYACHWGPRQSGGCFASIHRHYPQAWMGARMQFSYNFVAKNSSKFRVPQFFLFWIWHCSEVFWCDSNGAFCCWGHCARCCTTSLCWPPRISSGQWHRCRRILGGDCHDLGVASRQVSCMVSQHPVLRPRRWFNFSILLRFHSIAISWYNVQPVTIFLYNPRWISDR